MKTTSRIAVIGISLLLMLFADIPLLPVSLVPDADAIFGVRRRAWRRGAVIGYTAGAASANAAMYHQQSASTTYQQSATAQQQSATAQQQSATAQTQSAAAQHQAGAAAPAPAGKPLPLGTVVHALPGGCTSTPVGGVEYYYCGGNFYRAVFQGNTLVYVTAQPK
jgi:hypothetical protein